MTNVLCRRWGELGLFLGFGTLIEKKRRKLEIGENTSEERLWVGGDGRWWVSVDAGQCWWAAQAISYLNINNFLV